MRYVIFACSALSLTAAAGAAQAQQARQFDVRLSATATYDDNVGRSNDAAAAARGIEQKDMIYTPALSVDLVQPIGRQALFLNGMIGYEFYEKNDQLDHEQIALRGGAHTSFGPCKTTVAGGYNRQQSKLDDLSLLVTENVETVSSLSVDGVCGRELGLAPTFSAEQTWAENSANLRTGSDYVSTTGTVGLAYRRPTFGELALVANGGTTEYDRQVPSGGGGGLVDDGYDTYSFGLRFSRRLGARLQAGGTISHTSVRPNAATVSDFDGITYGFDVSYRASSRFDGQASFVRAVEPSNRQETSYQVSEAFDARVNYSLGSRFKFGLGGSYVDSSYDGGIITPVLSVTSEQVRTITTSVQFKASQRLSLTLDASQIERDANLQGFDYTDNRVGLTVVATY